jgi:hypothetical protein
MARRTMPNDYGYFMTVVRGVSVPFRLYSIMNEGSLIGDGEYRGAGPDYLIFLMFQNE